MAGAAVEALAGKEVRPGSIAGGMKICAVAADGTVAAREAGDGVEAGRAARVPLATAVSVTGVGNPVGEDGSGRRAVRARPRAEPRELPLGEVPARDRERTEIRRRRGAPPKVEAFLQLGEREEPFANDRLAEFPIACLRAGNAVAGPGAHASLHPREDRLPTGLGLD
ncbi:MAG: hypothetical protein HYZ53_25715 [Planctomycetes bacterium]|nr:hypothetical protein [Planctomycetota bacterium]